MQCNLRIIFCLLTCRFTEQRGPIPNKETDFTDGLSYLLVPRMYKLLKTFIIATFKILDIPGLGASSSKILGFLLVTSKSHEDPFSGMSLSSPLLLWALLELAQSAHNPVTSSK